MSENLKDILSAIPSLLIIVVFGFFAVRAVGGWRGFLSRRILGPLLVAPIGLAIMISGHSRQTTYGGAILMAVAFQVAGAWTALRYVQLTRVMDRIDPFVTGSAPLPFPDDDPACRRDLATATRLLADPTLSHRYDPELPARVLAIQDALPLLAGASGRD